MAVIYKDIKAKIEATELNEEELIAIEHVEQFIDEKINEVFDGSPISFDLNIIDFEYMPDKSRYIYFKRIRRIIMRNELERRYKKAGWKMEVDYADLSWIIQGE